MNQFNNLPPEIIEFIFNKVNLNDLINLRIVDKRFKQICEQIKFKQLSVANAEYYNLWLYTNGQNYDENLIRTSKFLNYRSIFKFDKYLKRLSIRFNGYGDFNKYDFNISILNEFKSLEKLQIYGFKLKDNCKLNLDNLKIASISFESDFKLTLDTNKLFAFGSNKLDQFVFNYPDKILFYETNTYDKIEIFYNLQHLKLFWVDHPLDIDRDILSKFKYLKVLDLFMYKYIKESEYDNLVEDIISILNEKKNLKRSELQIYFCGIKLIDQNQLNQLKWSDDLKQFKYNQLEFQIKNYDLLKDDCCYMFEINYCDLIKLIKIIPSSFTNKYPYILQVKANDHIDNEDQFIEFLSNLKYLAKLELINCGLTKLFYHKLIDLIYLNDLLYLKIEEKDDLDLNFDFIFNLKKLRYFETNQTMDYLIVLIYKLFKKNKYLENFSFKFNLKNYIAIERNSKKNSLIFRLYYLDDYKTEIENFSMEINDNFNLENITSLLKKWFPFYFFVIIILIFSIL